MEEVKVAESRSLMDAIKSDIKKSDSGGVWSNIFRLKSAGDKTRVRFLTEYNGGCSIVFHNKWQNYQHPCYKQYKKPCPNCGDSSGKTYNMYAWTVWNYENRKREIFVFAVNQTSPIPGLNMIEEENGDITAQDIVIQRTGEKSKTGYSLMPIGQAKPFRKAGVKPFTKKEIYETLFKAYKDTGEDESEEFAEEEEIAPPRPRSKKQAPKVPKIEKLVKELDLKELRQLARALGEKTKGFDEEDLIDIILDIDYEDIQDAYTELFEEEEEEPEEDDDPPFDEDDDEEEEILPAPRKRRK